MHRLRSASAAMVFVAVQGLAACVARAVEPTTADSKPIDFNRQIRAILSNNCFQCHGPDVNERKASLRVDTEDGLMTVIDRGQPESSELVRRLTSSDPDERMPPPKSGKKLSEADTRLVTEWVRQGAPYARHWSYVKPLRPPVPAASQLGEGNASWPKNAIDNFLLARLHQQGLRPSPEASRYALIRRASLDVTGLPPTLQEVERFVQDPDPRAYEHLIDRLLEKPTYGEHWGRLWLDLARYADSAGYADDPPRTIWAFRDYMIRALNANKPFDALTMELLAGDLLPDPTDDQLQATAFHRNTLTNNEGGTNDEEFRSVAVVDRVNTTLAVWMGTTINCCQCHNHKYDPITQEEFFRLFAFFNNTADADRADESPLMEVWSSEQRERKATLATEIAGLQEIVATPTPELLAAQPAWESQLAHEPTWTPRKPAGLTRQSGGTASIAEDATVVVADAVKSDTYTIQLPIRHAASTGAAAAESTGNVPLAAIRLETLPSPSLPNGGAGHGGGNFVISRISASLLPPEEARPLGRFLRIELPGSGKFLSLAEVQVFRGADNIAPTGAASQSSTAFEGAASRAIDGNTDGNYTANSTTHTSQEDNPWWELDLTSPVAVDRIVLFNRTDNGLHTRLKEFRVLILDSQRQVVWEKSVSEPPNPSTEQVVNSARVLTLVAAHADFAQDGFPAARVLEQRDPKAKEVGGWAVGPKVAEPHQLILALASPIDVPAGSRLELTIEQASKHENHTLGQFRVSTSGDAFVSEFARTPAPILAILRLPAAQRSAEQHAALTQHFLTVTELLRPQREQLAASQRQLAELKPQTTLPILRELPEPQRRVTRIQHRGNFMDLGKEVTPGVPAALHPLPEGAPPTRATLARWLVDEDNPLTARVLVNRYWEAIFGIGLVRTSEEFGSQGELPSHPELLDWLATEVVANHWDLKHLVRLLVTSAAYRQSSAVSPEMFEHDPDNRWLARGPRFRLSAEMVRDQALHISGLLSTKMHGAPVKPPQPTLGVNAAFGSGIDWKTSDGEDRYRRAMYTTWRRSNPYPSMAAFDAPNREVCTLRRDRTNTPLQALVTLNDPVYIEAAQSLARRIAATEGETLDKARQGFRLCLGRSPSDEELSRLVALYEKSRERFAQSPDKAEKMATQPLGPAPAGSDLPSLAAWTVVGNVMLNLDEMLMRP